jgi:hypothetical protein
MFYILVLDFTCPFAQTGAQQKASLSWFLSQKMESCCITDFIQNPEQGLYLSQAIAQDCAMAISDSSYHDQFGTVAWIMEGAKLAHSMRGVIVTPGSREDQSSYRSELAGLYALFLVSLYLCECYNI